MSQDLNISGTVISFPSSGASPNWAPAVIAFATAVEGALQAVVGPFDVPPQIQAIDAYNPGSNIDLQAAVFPPSDVRSVELIYAVNRSTDSQEIVEEGTLKAVYNASGTPGSKWTVQRFGVGEAEIEFTWLDTGVVQFSTNAISGANHTGAISFQAKSLLQES